MVMDFRVVIKVIEEIKNMKIRGHNLSIKFTVI